VFSEFLAFSPAATAAATANEWTEATYAVTAPAPKGYDRPGSQAAVLDELKQLITLDTQNPPGNERLVADHLNSILRDLPGVETRVIDLGKNRANFVARLRAGNPQKRAVIVMAHMDVVGVDLSKWTTPPFAPTERDGYLYGRGSIDDKGMLAAAVVAFKQLAALRETLTRDIILLGTADEESGGSGIETMVQHHKDLIGDADFALNEGGRIRVSDGRIKTVNIQTTEKVYHEVRITARGPSGHGSVPLPENALAALARAVARVHDWKAPVRLNETTRTYFARMAAIESDPALAGAMRKVSAAGATGAEIDAAAAVLSQNPQYNAVLRSGHALTMLNGGFRANVIPSEGTATFNLRTMPGDDANAIMAEMQRVAGEPSVTFELTREARASPPPSPITSALFVAMEDAAKAMVPGVHSIPFMSTGATDGAHLRAAGIATYGILPMPMPAGDELRMHGDDERVPVPALGWACEYIYRVLLEVGSTISGSGHATE